MRFPTRDSHLLVLWTNARALPSHSRGIFGQMKVKDRLPGDQP